MIVKNIYETIDGKSFENHDEAVKHELFLIKDLLQKDFLYTDCPDCPFVEACKEIADCGICHLIGDLK